MTKTRQQKIYSDVLGRTAKTEVLDWDGTGPGGVGRRTYSTTVNTYNARDQITLVRQYAGAEGSGTYQDTTMGYDGYGRLQSKHVPEQDVNTATVWTYNADDTVNTITDARGAVTTYGYSGTNRHLVKRMTHALTGSPTIVTSFTYDAVGNRLSMTDGLGSVSYAYDQLARLTSEIRSFNGVGSFSINYTYNLAGELLTVTDPFGASFSYTRDVQGRLKNVSGSPYAGTTSYVNDVAYRAWGAPKTVLYNGSNSTISFNARLQPTQFRLTNSNGGSIIREDYSYFSDGKRNGLTDLDDTAGINPPVSLRFLSRAYSYDLAGRVGSVYGTGSSGVPFNQSYSYDEFDNMTIRSGNYYNYNHSGPATDTASYTNNRRSNWTYNAEGQVLSTPLTSTDRPRTMTYDAADRMVTTVQSNQFDTVTYSAFYDGDGQLVYETSNTSPGSFNASYIVRSTVLAGEVLTRLDQFGNKLITHVPAEGLLFATQRSSGASGAYVDFRFRNPLGITETSKAVYDPLGNYIPFQASGDPRPPAGSYNSGSMSGLSSSEADPNSLGVGCIMDGMPTNCRRVMQAINNENFRSVVISGLALSPTITQLMSSVTEIPPQSHRIGHPFTMEMPDGKGVTFTVEEVELTGHFIIAPGMQRGFEQNPQNIRKVDLQKQITILPGSFDSEDEASVRNAVEHLLDEKCDDAFRAIGLSSPADIIFNKGIVLGAATLVLNSANNSSSGITEYARTRDLQAVGSTGIQAFTIRNKPGGPTETTDERARIFLNRSAFAGGVYSLQDVITHEFLHVAGMAAANVPFYGPLIRQNDLSYVKNSNAILEACK